MNPVFSIVVPVYNTALYLSECLDSIVAQTVEDWEAICVDDGSSDDSKRVLDTYAENDPRFIVVHQPNAGVSVARNRALDLARGRYVLFIDSDDVWIDSELLRNVLQLKGRDERPGDIVLFGYLEFCCGGLPRFPHQTIKSVRMVDIVSEIPQDVMRCHSIFGVYPREMLQNTRFPSLSWGEDRVFFAKVLVLASRVVLLDYKAYGYRRQRKGSAMNSSMSIRRFVDGLEFLLSIDKIFKDGRKRVVGENHRFVAAYRTEMASESYFKLCRAERKRARNSWNKSLMAVAMDGQSPMWFRICSRIALFIQWDWIRRLLFWIPQRLKSKGIHRHSKSPDKSSPILCSETDVLRQIDNVGCKKD